MGDAQKQLSQPFPQEEALREKTKRLEELTAELDMDSSTKTNSAEEIITQKSACPRQKSIKFIKVL